MPVVEYIVAIDVTRVRFPADASCHTACWARSTEDRSTYGTDLFLRWALEGPSRPSSCSMQSECCVAEPLCARRRWGDVCVGVCRAAGVWHSRPKVPRAADSSPKQPQTTRSSPEPTKEAQSSRKQQKAIQSSRNQAKSAESNPAQPKLAQHRPWPPNAAQLPRAAQASPQAIEGGLAAQWPPLVGEELRCPSAVAPCTQKVTCTNGAWTHRQSEVVAYIVAIDVTRVRFPADASCHTACWAARRGLRPPPIRRSTDFRCRLVPSAGPGRPFSAFLLHPTVEATERVLCCCSAG